MDNIIATMPWQCGDKDCKAKWHLRNYWAYADGKYSVDSFSDGGHLDIEEADIPGYEAIERAWAEYATFVIKTGNDPLGEYHVKRSTKRKELWRFRFENSILGVMLVAARKSRKPVPFEKLPDYVHEYLGLEGRVLKAFGLDPHEPDDPVERLRRAGHRLHYWNYVELERDVPRTGQLISRELRSLARKHLRDITARQLSSPCQQPPPHEKSI